jgi:hypothetical protein
VPEDVKTEMIRVTQDKNGARDLNGKKRKIADNVHSAERAAAPSSNTQKTSIEDPLA